MGQVIVKALIAQATAHPEQIPGILRGLADVIAANPEFVAALVQALSAKP